MLDKKHDIPSLIYRRCVGVVPRYMAIPYRANSWKTANIGSRVILSPGSESRECSSDLNDRLSSVTVLLSAGRRFNKSRRDGGC